ncbi:hypothetical protein [Cetobacterium ceti]
MKKYLILAVMVLGSISAFADGPNDVMENRVENTLKVQVKTFKDVDYDVDIANNMANVDIEVPSSQVKEGYDFNPLAKEVAQIVKTETGISDTTVSVEIDHPISDDQLVFTRTFK